MPSQFTTKSSYDDVVSPNEESVTRQHPAGYPSVEAISSQVSGVTSAHLTYYEDQYSNQGRFDQASNRDDAVLPNEHFVTQQQKPLPAYPGIEVVLPPQSTSPNTADQSLKETECPKPQQCSSNEVYNAQAAPTKNNYLVAMPLRSLQQGPGPVDCPICGVREVTTTEFVSGNYTHVSAALCCLILCLGCIPYVTSAFKDVEHKCGHCGALLAVWHRSGNTVVIAHGAI